MKLSSLIAFIKGQVTTETGNSFIPVFAG
jgi:chloramphenicol O-acetyltransferase